MPPAMRRPSTAPGFLRSEGAPRLPLAWTSSASCASGRTSRAAAWHQGDSRSRGPHPSTRETPTSWRRGSSLHRAGPSPPPTTRTRDSRNSTRRTTQPHPPPRDLSTALTARPPPMTNGPCRTSPMTGEPCADMAPAPQPSPNAEQAQRTPTPGSPNDGQAHSAAVAANTAAAWLRMPPAPGQRKDPAPRIRASKGEHIHPQDRRSDDDGGGHEDEVPYHDDDGGPRGVRSPRRGPEEGRDDDDQMPPPGSRPPIRMDPSSSPPRHKLER